MNEKKKEKFWDNYSKTKKLVKEEIDKREKDSGKKLTDRQKKYIAKKISRKVNRERAIRGIIAAASLALGVGGTLAISSNKQSENTEIEAETTNLDEKETTFKDEYKVDLSQENSEETTKDYSQVINYEQLYVDILNQYNQKYGTDLTEDDVSLIKSSNTQFLGIDENGTYIQDYKENTPVTGYIRNGVDKNNIGNIYIMINENDNSIIGSLGKVNYEIVNIDTKIIMNYDGKEYLESDKKMDLTKVVNDEEGTKLQLRYEALEKQFEKQELEKEQQASEQEHDL